MAHLIIIHLIRMLIRASLTYRLFHGERTSTVVQWFILNIDMNTHTHTHTFVTMGKIPVLIWAFWQFWSKVDTRSWLFFLIINNFNTSINVYKKKGLMKCSLFYFIHLTCRINYKYLSWIFYTRCVCTVSLY